MESDGWLSREMGSEVSSAPACYGSSLGSIPDIPQKYKMGDINKRSVQHTLARQNISKKPLIKQLCVPLTRAEKINFCVRSGTHTQIVHIMKLVPSFDVPRSHSLYDQLK
jgi:hypothetical protein